MSPEKREYKRIKKHFIAKLRIRSQAKLSGDWEMVTLEDLSAGGALFSYNSKLEIGELLDFRIQFPLSKNSVECVGKVIRYDQAPMPSLFHIAIIFVEISEKDREAIGQLGENLYLKHPEKFDYWDRRSQ